MGGREPEFPKGVSALGRLRYYKGGVPLPEAKGKKDS